MITRAVLLTSATLLVMASTAVLADVVHLDGGRKLVGRAEEIGDIVRVELPHGAVEIPRDRVVRIERAELPAESVARRRKDLADGDAQGALDLAAAAGLAGLHDQQGELIELAVRWAPESAEATRSLRLWKIFGRQVPDDLDAERRLLADFGEKARLLRTRHWYVVHDVPESAAREHGEMLEAAWRKFHELAEELGVPPQPLEQRLEIMLFSNHEQWSQELALPADAIRGMNGMFVGRTGRVLVYDAQTAPEVRKAREDVRKELDALSATTEKLDGQEAEIDKLRSQIENGPNVLTEAQRKRRTEARELIEKSMAAIETSRAKVADREEALRRYEVTLASHLETESLAATTHEACHQLAFATGLARPGEPRWLTEGLATLFEVTSRTDFVLAAPNRARLQDARHWWQKERGRDLRRLVGDRLFADAETGLGLAYAELWSLAYYLAMRQRENFARFVRETRPAPAGANVAEHQIAEFRRFFGDDLDALEREWLRYVDRL